MEDLFDHSCSISDGGKPNSTSSGKLTSAISDKPTSASSSRKPASAASSKTADRGRSVSISLEYPSGPSSPPRVDDDIMDVDPPASSAVSEEVEVTDGISSSKNDALFAPNGQLDLSRSGSGVPTATFYGSTYNKKGKRKAVETLTISDSEDMADDRKQEEEVDDMLAVTEVGHSDSSVTHIFTLDSLGAKHPQAIRILRNYLKMEAKDKKGIEPENTREAAGRQALVPAQPNFCDCGVYLLHFAKTFMTDPLRFYTTINSKKSSLHSERKVEWNEEAIPLFRQDLIGRIEELSATWKAERAAKEELKKKKAAAGDDVGKGQEEADSSEGEVDIVEDLVQEVPVKPSPRAKAKPVSKAAARLRG
ncbi:hypothetical protein BV22DRAFT_801106 [Leucogyrophana mollusca]|uniref:Uncharacterized protein n=1 Tax=Leucogyrophana mollusca TaxID=85980 RepID=A0ACB8B4M5_9AGAM|nr:hypothetical protein BV22DRAFT_801106 [Leucogyrophana mollusca]